MPRPPRTGVALQHLGDGVRAPNERICISGAAQGGSLVRLLIDEAQCLGALKPQPNGLRMGLKSGCA